MQPEAAGAALPVAFLALEEGAPSGMVILGVGLIVCSMNWSSIESVSPAANLAVAAATRAACCESWTRVWKFVAIAISNRHYRDMWLRISFFGSAGENCPPARFQS